MNPALDAARRAVARVPELLSGPCRPELIDGEAGVLLGMAAVAELAQDAGLCEYGGAIAERLAAAFSDTVVAPAGGVRAGIGLARGASGVGLALVRWAASIGDDAMLDGALRAWRCERPWADSAGDWYGASAHTWSDDGTLARSVCSGAAGIGMARFAGYRVTGAASLLAEGSAAVDVIRRVDLRAYDPDASLCHGAAGEVDLLVTASVATGEPAHLEAARRLGELMVVSARRRGGYASVIGDFGPTPAFLLGSAGTGLALLRLHDPGLVPCGAFPVLPVTDADEE